MNSKDRIRRLCGAFGVAALLLGSPAAAVQVEIVLIPAAAWNDGRPDPAARVGGGTVHLFQTGDRFPRRSVASDGPFDLPPGRWLWSAEAPGFVSVRTGEIAVGAGAEGAPRRLLWPVVPACRVTLAGAETDLRGVGRVDVVSVAHGSVAHLNAAPGAAAHVAAGQAFAYSISPAGVLSGLGRPFPCTPRSEVTLSPPRAPARSVQDLLVRATARGAAAALTGPPLLQVRGEPGPEPRGADLTLFDGSAWVALFYALPGGSELTLEARGGEVRSRTLALAPAPGTAREVVVDLAPRRAATLAVDYRPARAHGSAVLELLDCGATGGNLSVPRSRCKPAAPAQELRPGLHEYRFAGLDDGWYLVDARVDREWVPGLGAGVAVELAADGDEEWTGGPIRLEEQHVFGEIRAGGRAVPGELRVRDAVSSGAGARRFPTDDEEIYHFYYFSRQLDPRVLLGADSGRDRDDFRGFSAVSGGLLFCGEGAGCSALHPLSTLIGSGRLDFELGEGARSWEIEVVAASSGEPLADAWVVHRRPEKVLLFERGEVRWLEPRFSPGGSLSGVDAEGRVRLRLEGDGDEGAEVTVGADGYAERRVELDPGLPESQVVRVELEPKDRAGEPRLELRLAGGGPAASAVLLARLGGHWASRCALAADARGEVRLRAGCEGAEAYLVLHPAARLELLAASEVHAGARVELSAAPAKPLAVRVVDEEGHPLAGQVVELHFGRIAVSTFDLMRGGIGRTAVPGAVTDEDGRILLGGLDPQAPGAPELAVPGASRRTALDPYRPGDTVELVVD